jgi:hypothetical protein
MKKIILFSQTYCVESLNDLQRDIVESLDPRFNDTVNYLPEGEHGLIPGTFKVTMEWTPDEDGDN